MDALLGTEVGSYRLIRVLGEGGMGRVYVGEQAEIASRVAIKVLTTKDPDLVARFFAEARAVNVIKHPGLVKVLALSHLPDGRPYIIMELVEGETLRTLVVRDAPLPIAGVLDMMKQLLAALGAAHARGVVHRDLKPDNVMITADGTVKVLDFGIAKLSTTLGGGNLTQVGAQIGTPAYMAPEQIRGDEVDARTDIYAAGVLLYEAITARHPFEAETEYELLKGHLESPPPRLSARRRDAPAALEAIVEKALAKKPIDRFASAKELSEALVAAGIAPQKLVARLPVTGPRAVLPPVEVATVKERRARDATADTPVAPLPRATVEYKRPSQQPIEPTRDEKTAPSRRTRWIVGAAVPLAAIVIAIAVWPRGERSDVRAPLDARVATPADAPPHTDATAIVVQTRSPGGNERRARIDRPVDAKRFDVIANITKATLLARQLVPNVVLTGFRLDSVNAKGRVDFDGTHVVVYYFAIPDLPLTHDNEAKHCRVGVTVSESGWEALTMLDNMCGQQTKRIPVCTIPEVWQRASKAGESTARIEWFGGRWLFAGSGPQNDIADDCVRPMSPSSTVVVDAGIPDAATAMAAPNQDRELVYKQPDFDPKRIDPVAYLAKARAHARELVADADLFSIHMYGLNERGEVDLVTSQATIPSAVTYLFVGGRDGATCSWVSVGMGKDKVVIQSTKPNRCTPTYAGPACTAAHIWKRAKPPTPTMNAVVTVTYGWQIGSDIYADDCK